MMRTTMVNRVNEFPGCVAIRQYMQGAFQARPVPYQ
jgi:hypothetical protein